MTRSRRIRLQALRFVIFALAAAFFLVPIGAMFEFSTRGIGINSARTFSAWAAIPSTPELATAITVSLELALITSLLTASLLSASLGLGEYTFANLLNYENLQVAIQYVSLVSAGTSIAVAVASLLFAFVLLMILSFAGGRLQVRSPGQRA